MVQSVLGIALSVILFQIAFKETRRPAISLIIGLSPSVCLNLLFFEAVVMTETLSAFLVIASLYSFRSIIRERNAGTVAYASAGTLIALAALTRPFLVFLAPLCGFFFLVLWIGRRRPPTESLRAGVAFALPVFLLLLGWCYFNKRHFDYFGLTTLTGFNLSNKSGAFIEYAPDKYAAIRDPYLKYRAWDSKRRKIIKETGVDSVGFWNPFAEMQRLTGYSHAELSRALTEVSLHLFREHPLLYLNSVFWAWCEFWKVTITWDIGKISYPPIRQILKVAWPVERFLLLLIEATFLMIGVLYGYRTLRGKRSEKPFSFALMTIVLSGGLLQALIESGSARFAIPFQPLMLYVVLEELAGRWRGPSGRFLPAGRLR
jgi:hypothetical protein